MSTEEQLKAENARLKADAQVILKHLDEASADCARLKAEVERLRKAGDAMALCIIEFRCGKYGNALDKVGGFYVWQDWKAAKQGKPTV